MSTFLKYLLFFSIFFFLSFQSSNADIPNDSQQIFNLAEQSYPQRFTTRLKTRHFPPEWPYFRGPYPNNLYLGVNKKGIVYVKGGDFGNKLLRLGTTQEILAFLKSDPQSNTASQNAPFGAGAGRVIATQNLSSVAATMAALENINGLEKVTSNWFTGEWVAFYFDNGRVVEQKLNFHSNGTYQSESITQINNTPKVIRAEGRWLVLSGGSDGKFNLTLWNATGNLRGNYPIENEGNNGLRLINQSSKPDVRSVLYSRLNSSANVRFPGMFLLGDFEYINYKGRKNQHLFRYQFNKNGTVRRRIYGDFSLDRALQSDTTGRWTISANGDQLRLTFRGKTNAFTIRNATHSTVSMYTSATNYQYWKRLQEPRIADIDSFIGEFQGNNKEGYLSIQKNGNGYLVDVVEPFEGGKEYQKLRGTRLKNGQLSVKVPAQYNGETQLILEAGYNRLLVKETPAQFFFQTSNDYLEKVSSTPLKRNPVNILGQWRNTLYSGKGSYYIFLDDGRYYSSRVSSEYGTYTLNGNTLTLSPVCGGSYKRTAKIVDHRLKLDTIYYTPTPGIRELGRAGTQLENTLFKAQLDRRKETYGAKLKPHPRYRGVFVFAEKTEFLGSYVKMSFKADGTGTQFSGAIYEVYDFWDLRRYIGLEIDSFSFGIEYYVTKEGDKEAVVFYNTGIWTSSYRGVQRIGSAAGNPASARSLKLYHGRSAVCYTFNDQDGGRVLPIVN